MGSLLDDRCIVEAKIKRDTFIAIPSLDAFPELVHGFTTRFGGVSTGDYATLNLNFNRPDPESNVKKNYEILSNELEVPLDNMVLSHQVHDKRILKVTKEHRGMGIVRERSYKNIDGLVTQEPCLMLVTYYADCVPIYFYDPVDKVIGLAHSGWRGTLLNIGGETVRAMKESFGCSPENVFVSFGPHIKTCCFEVDHDVADVFISTYTWAGSYITKRAGNWIIELESIIIKILTEQGVLERIISGCRICKKCNRDVFFSHRGSKNQTGTGAAFLMIRG